MSLRALTRRLRRWERYTRRISGDPHNLFMAPGGHINAEDRVLAERARRGLPPLSRWRRLR